MDFFSLYVCIFSILVYSGKTQVKIDLKDEENYGIVFEGEDVTMVCQAQDDSVGKVYFVISFNGAAIIAGDMILPEGMEQSVSVATITSKRIEFVLESVARNTSGVYKCQTGVAGRNSTDDSIHLVVYHNNEVLCRQNSSDMYISMQGLLLSCYFAPLSISTTFMWVKVSNGITSVIPSTSTHIGNGIKRKITSTLLPSDDLTPATYTCQSSIQSGESCTTSPHVIFNKPFLAFAPSITTLAPGDRVNISCESVIMPGSPVFWIIGDVSAGVTAHNVDSDFLNVTVALTAASASYVNASCGTFYNGSLLTRGLHITVQNSSDSLPMDNGQGVDNFGSTAVTIIVVGSIAVVVLIGILVAIIFTVKICDSLTENTQKQDPSNGHGRFDKHHGSRSDTNKKDEDPRAVPATPAYDNNRGTSHRDHTDGGRVPPTNGYDHMSYGVEMENYNGGGGDGSARDGSVMNELYDSEVDQDYSSQQNEVYRPVSVHSSEVNANMDYY